MHPRSKQWHLLDYVIVRQRDWKDVLSTRAMRGATCWSDHRLIRSKMCIQLAKKKNPARPKPPKKLNVGCIPSRKTELQQVIHDSLEANPISEDADIETAWKTLHDTIYKAAADTTGFVARTHKDWFDENDGEINDLLETLHIKHAEYIANKTCQQKKDSYKQWKQVVQLKLRDMKNAWWEKKSQELQVAADTHHMKSFHEGLRAVYGPKTSGTTPVRSADQTILLTDKRDILSRWAEHFNSLLNRHSEISDEAIDSLPQLPPDDSLANLPTGAELRKALKQTTSGKSPGADGIPAEIYKNGGEALEDSVLALFKLIWVKGFVPQDFKNATIVHIYKRKGDKTSCDNHRGISLLCIAGKILARIVLNRIINTQVIPEAQCGFRSGRGTCDMVFAIHQLQEKCCEQNMELHMVFVDLTKAFDTVSRQGLWKVLEKFGCSAKLIELISSFHNGMQACVQEAAEISEPFPVDNGVKQGCVLAPTLFSIFFAAMLIDAFGDCDRGVFIQYRTDGNLFNLRRLKAKFKVCEVLLREFLFADDCALVAHVLEDMQDKPFCHIM